MHAFVVFNLGEVFEVVKYRADDEFVEGTIL